MTGVTSFSGYWFARKLIMMGNELIIVRTTNQTTNHWLTELKRESLGFQCEFFGTELMNCISIDALLLHGSSMQDRRSLDFNIPMAVEKTVSVTKWINKYFETKAVVHTGTFSENNESVGENPLQSFNPYSTSKQLIYENHKRIFEGVPLLKYVMPNPFGQLQQNNLFSYLEKVWAQKEVPIISKPDYIRDFVPIDLLSTNYSKIVEEFILGKYTSEKYAPSYFIGSNKNMATIYSNEISRRIGIELPLKFEKQLDYDEPRIRININPANLIVKEWRENQFWDNLAIHNFGGSSVSNKD